MNGRPDVRMALVHDFLLDLRGAERVFLAMCDLWPDADVFTPVYDPDGTEGRFEHRNIHTSPLQKLRPTARTFRVLLPFYPAAIESFDLSGYDLVVSSSSAWAHAVMCDEDTVHLTYCHNPFRYVWNDRDATLAARRNPLTREALRVLFRRWRQWDWIAAQRVDRYVANSRATQRRIATYFGRESTVVYPPVETERFRPGSVGDFYLVLSELMPHKRIQVAIEAFNRLKLPLIVVGDGPDSRRLRRMAGPGIRFLGRVGDDLVAQLLSACRALVVTAIEEFGIAAVEAQAAGRPVIGMAGGGVRETVREGETGVFWHGGPEELAEAVTRFDETEISPEDCVRNAGRFNTAAFRRRLVRQVEEVLSETDAQPRHDARRTRLPARAPMRGLGRRLR
ncbi:MAG TPA: glycosyltransferase [Thermoleophilaceae bacterium]|nr:glycosyltransferase [Thermoleophilaceae bacterium]